MTTRDRGPGGGDLDDDPLQRPASDAGWVDQAPAPPAAEPATTVLETTPAARLSEPAITAAQPAEPPILPAAYDENDLRAAVGASPLRATHARRDHEDDDDELPRPRRNRKAIGIVVLTLCAGVTVGAVALVGRVNSDRYVLACEAERAVPEQGRAFPPWGTHPITGEAWAPLKIAAETRCQPREVDDPVALERLYLAMVLDQADALVTARDAAKLDEADLLLKQALLLTRPPQSEPPELARQRSERHAEVQRLQGDITYGRAALKLRDATAALGDAAKQFDAATALRPRHATDAAAWASYARRLADQLQAGPAAGAAPSPGIVDKPIARPNVPVGVALPVAPGVPSPASTSPAPAEAPAAESRAPAGGVLL
jgi:hypothetical protein